MKLVKIMAVAALIAFQLFSLTQLWSAWTTGAIYVRQIGMTGVDGNHAAYTQHMALYVIGAASAGYFLLRLWQRRSQR